MTIHSLSLLFLILLRATSTYGQKESVQEPQLAKEISKMRDEDQKMRVKWSSMIRKGKTETQKFKEFTQELIAKDRANTIRMRAIVDEYGWPTYQMVGHGPSNSAWLVVQHADRNPLFQARCLPLLKQAVDAGQANPSNYAYLYDRVQVAMGKKQRYATQSSSNNGLYEGTFYPIEDEARVQERRLEMNLQPSVEDYATSQGFSYAILTEEEATTKAQKLAEDYQEHLRQAKEAMEAKQYSEAAAAFLKVTTAHGHVTKEDFIEAARALSLSRHAEARKGTNFLMKAMTRGWEGFSEIRDHPDFAYLKEVNTANWEDFLKTANEMALDRP